MFNTSQHEPMLSRNYDTNYFWLEVRLKLLEKNITSL